ncbi:MAG: hypothetical protein QOD75_255 [Blastocatellia bacterium]|jgi:hypothetical protein|nr:hypothetical protein [Blastocatellia bacterium]
MQQRSIRFFALAVAALVLLGVFVSDAGAQTRKKRRPRRVQRGQRAQRVQTPVITNPAIYDPSTATVNPAAGVPEDKIISTADEATGDPEATSQNPRPAKSKSEEAEMQQTINKLSGQVERLSDQLKEKEDLERDRLDMERLTRAEQRAEALRAQLLDLESKMADLQQRLDQVEYSLKPENIERATQGGGTVHPEEARDSRRRQLENEKARLQAQIRLLETSKARLEPSIATADSEVDMLRAKLQMKREQEIVAPPKPEPRPAGTRRKP